MVVLGVLVVSWLADCVSVKVTLVCGRGFGMGGGGCLVYSRSPRVSLWAIPSSSFGPRLMSA